MFCRLPVNKLSRQITLCPDAINESHRCEPRNPAPPVTNERGIPRVYALLSNARDPPCLTARLRTANIHTHATNPPRPWSNDWHEHRWHRSRRCPYRRLRTDPARHTASRAICSPRPPCRTPARRRQPTSDARQRIRGHRPRSRRSARTGIRGTASECRHRPRRSCRITWSNGLSSTAGKLAVTECASSCTGASMRCGM